MWASNSPAGPLSCQSTGPAVCLTGPIILPPSHLAIVPPTFSALSNLLSRSLPLSVSRPQVPRVIISMCLILNVFHPRRNTRRGIRVYCALEKTSWEHAQCVLRWVSFLNHCNAQAKHALFGVSTLPYMAVSAATGSKLVRKDHFGELMFSFLSFVFSFSVSLWSFCNSQ